MRTLTCAVVAVGLVLGLIAPAAAGPLEDAQAADQRGDYATELTLLKPLAQHGNAIAQTSLGYMYEYGNGMPSDSPSLIKANDAQALAWYRKAVDQGNALAEYRLGMMYAGAKGVAEDQEEAARLMLLSAKQGNANAQTDLAERYASGRGVAPSDEETLKWYGLAHAQEGAAEWWLVSTATGHTHSLVFSGCDPGAGDFWHECVGFELDCVEASYWPLSQLTIISDVRNGIIVKHLVAVSYPADNLTATFDFGGGATVTSSILGFRVAGDDLNGGWDLTVDLNTVDQAPSL